MLISTGTTLDDPRRRRGLLIPSADSDNSDSMVNGAQRGLLSTAGFPVGGRSEGTTPPITAPLSARGLSPAPEPSPAAASPTIAPLAPRTPIRGLGPAPAKDPDQLAGKGEFNRLTAPPQPNSIPRYNAEGGLVRMQHNPLAHTKDDTGQSGIGQIHNPVARGLLRAADVLGSVFAPAAMVNIPGTTLHHQQLVRQQAGANETRQDLATKEAQQEHMEAAADQERATTEAKRNPPKKYGTPLKTSAGYVVPEEGSPTAVPLTGPDGKQVTAPDGATPHTIQTDQGILQFNPETGRFDINVGKAPAGGAVHQLADGTFIIARPDGTATQLTINGQPAKGNKPGSQAAPRTVEVGNKVMQWNPETHKYDIPVGPIPQHSTGTPQTTTVLKPGTAPYRVAQDIAYGRLSFQQFRTLVAYGRDTGLKMAIYDQAGQLNPNFNAATFEMGYKLASNPRVQQQLASLDNVMQAIPDMVKVSDGAARTGIKFLNKIAMAGGIQFGNKKYSNFHTAQIAFADELSGALGYGTATDMSREMGFNMTDPNLSPESFAAGLREIVAPFVERKRSTLLNQMGVYGQPGMNPAADAPRSPEAVGGGHVIEVNGKRYRYKGTGPTDNMSSYEEVKR